MSIPYLNGQIAIFYMTANIFNNKNRDSLSVNSQNVNLSTIRETDSEVRLI